MIVDLVGAETSPFEGVYDLCVCGSGPAGMTVAREAASRGLRVVLLEAGGFDLTTASQDVYKATSVGPLTYYGVETCRLRYFGGTSGHWAGRCAIFQPIDFEARDIWDGLPGWPIGHTEAYRRLDDAREILDIADQSLEPRREPKWRNARFRPSGFARSAPTRFGDKFRDELKQSDRITVALNANVLSLDLSEDRSAVTAVEVDDWRDRRFKISARRTALAFGSLENARFLLNMAALGGAPIGDKGGFVGRCFMEHFDIVLGRFVADRSPIWQRESALSVTLTDETARRRGVGSAVVALAPNAQPRHYGRLAPIRRLINDAQCAFGSSDDRDNICAGDGLATDIIEQTPNRDSRVTLDKSSKDRFGHFHINVDWRLSAQGRQDDLGGGGRGRQGDRGAKSRTLQDRGRYSRRRAGSGVSLSPDGHDAHVGRSEFRRRRRRLPRARHEEPLPRWFKRLSDGRRRQSDRDGRRARAAARRASRRPRSQLTGQRRASRGLRPVQRLKARLNAAGSEKPTR